jgi:hypothetical protein
MDGQGGAQHLRLTGIAREPERPAALVQSGGDLVARKPDPRAHVPAVPLHEVTACGADLREEVLGDSESLVPIASPVGLRDPLRLEPADVREMPEPLRVPARPGLELEAGPEVAEVAVEVGEHPAVVGSQGRIDLLDHDDASLEIRPSLGVAGHSSGGADDRERPRLELDEPERLRIRQSGPREHDCLVLLGREGQEHRQVQARVDLRSRWRAILHERQRSIRVLEEPLLRLRPLVGEVREQDGRGRGQLGIACLEEPALRLREHVVACVR